MAKLASPKDIVVIMSIDGVRWQEVFGGSDPRLLQNPTGRSLEWQTPRGLMPNLHSLAERQGALLGTDAAPMAVSNAVTVSLPGYMELFSGNSTTCQNNDCAPTALPTVLDAWGAKYPAASITVLASWARISRAAARDYSHITLSAGRSIQSHSELFCTHERLCATYQSGLHAAAWPGFDDYRPDSATAALATEYVKVQHPQVLFVGLGDTDEYAHRGDYKGYLAALHAADETLGAIDAWLEQMEHQGHRTLLVCTADHGRARSFRHHGGAPEAARVWALFAGSVVKARGRLTAAPTRLADVAPTIREVVGLPGGGTQPDAGRSLLPLLADSQPVHVQYQANLRGETSDRKGWPID